VSLDLTQANLDGVALQGANLHRADLTRAVFAQPYHSFRKRGYVAATLKNAILTQAALRGATLCGVDLARAQLQGADLEKADLRGADLTGADLTLTILEGANLERAKLTRAILTGANLARANLAHADLSKADLSEAILREANLSRANLKDATLPAANLIGASLVQTNLAGATLTGSHVYGVSAWDIRTDDRTVFRDLDVSPEGDGNQVVDELEIAQFYYLLLTSPNIRKAINTIGRKGVLILGRFTPKRKAVLDAMRDKLRELHYLPFLFDFQKPEALDFTETVVTLAGMSRFVIVDITNPSSSPLELKATVPTLNIPFVPIIQKNQRPFSMFKDLQKAFGENSEARMIDLLTYSSPKALLGVFEKAVVNPAIERGKILAAKKNSTLRTRDADDYRD